MSDPRPTFRWNVLAFVAVIALTLMLATALLVLLDPRSQGWWGDRFSDLGTAIQQLIAILLRR
ncbi:MAG: hypothetical protein HYX56_00315 [Chloroflexi bacterium]|nr:hypothetical protein [Chloroflexota bacterium]